MSTRPSSPIYRRLAIRCHRPSALGGPHPEYETLAQLQTATTVEKNLGRIETRTITTTTATIDEHYLDWPGAKQLIRLECHTIEMGQTRRNTAYAITSLSRTRAEAAFMLMHLRGRWYIENRCFYVLDTVLGDDASRSRTRHVARALNGILLATLNISRRLTQTVGFLCREHAVKPNVMMTRLRILKYWRAVGCHRASLATSKRCGYFPAFADLLESALH